MTTVQGITPEFVSIRNSNVEIGRFFSNQEVDTRMRVTVGVFEAKGQSAGGIDQDDVAIIPLTTAQERMMGISYVQTISVQAVSPESINQVQDDITSLLRSRHKLSKMYLMILPFVT